MLTLILLNIILWCRCTALQDPLPIDPNRPAGYPIRGVKTSNPTTVSIGSVLDTNEAKETFLKVRLSLYD